MTILSINNVQCKGKSPSQVTQLIKEATGEIVMLVDDEIKKEAAEDEILVSATAVSTESPPNQISHRPPAGLEAGGRWGTAKYFGDKSLLYTLLLCVFCAPFCCYMACCPQDEKDAYRINGKVYDADGKYIGNPE